MTKRITFFLGLSAAMLGVLLFGGGGLHVTPALAEAPMACTGSGPGGVAANGDTDSCVVTDSMNSGFQDNVQLQSPAFSNLSCTAGSSITATKVSTNECDFHANASINNPEAIGTIAFTVGPNAAEGSTYNNKWNECNTTENYSGCAGDLLHQVGSGSHTATGTGATVPTGSPSQLAFTVEPSATGAGQTITPAVKVSIEDSNGNVVTNDTNDITLAIQNNPATGTLSGTLTVAAVAGIATFNDLSIDHPGNGYTLSANDGGDIVGPYESASFNITPAALSITKTHSGNFKQGATGTHYTITISDSAVAGSGATSAAVSATDTAPTGLTVTAMTGTGWTCTTLPTCTRSDTLQPGGSYPPITVSVNVANNAPNGINSVTNQATVSGGGDPNPHTANDPTTVTGPVNGPSPSLSITKTHSGDGIAGGAAVYTVQVSNGAAAGPTTGTVVVTDHAPPGMKVNSMSGTGWTCIAVTCSRSDALAASGNYPSISVAVSISADAPASLTNHVSVIGGGDPSGPHTASDPTNITGGGTPPTPANLAIRSAHNGSFTAGQGATYTLTVLNAAGSTSGTVTVDDQAPATFAVTRLSGIGWDCTLSSCRRSDALGVGSYPVITVSGTVSLHAPASITNFASVTGGGDPTGPHTASDPTTVTGGVVLAGSPSLSITSSHGGTFSEGQLGVVYTLKVTNSGTALTSGAVTVTDPGTAGLTVVAMSGTGWSCTLSSCTRSDSLALTASYPDIIVEANVAPNAPIGSGAIANHASVTGGGDPSGPHSTSDPTNISR